MHILWTDLNYLSFQDKVPWTRKKHCAARLLARIEKACSFIEILTHKKLLCESEKKILIDSVLDFVFLRCWMCLKCFKHTNTRYQTLNWQVLLCLLHKIQTVMLDFMPESNKGRNKVVVPGPWLLLHNIAPLLNKAVVFCELFVLILLEKRFNML